MRQASLARPLIPSGAAFSSTASIPVAALLGLAVGAAIVSKPLLVVALVALALAGVGIAVAFANPALAFVGLVLLMVLIPSYASPAVGPLLFIPAAAASWMLAVALAWRNAITKGREALHLNAIDLGVGAFVLLMAISIWFSARTSRNEYLHLMFLWAGPYLAVRLLLAEVKRPMRVIAISFALGTAILAPVALAETLGASNPFHSLNFNSTEFAVWAGQADRFGQVRAEASFGHPIAFSMFVTASALLSLAMGLNSGQRRERNLWYASAVLGLGVQAMTVSRTGWLMLLIGIVMMALVVVRGAQRQKLAGVVAVVGLVVLIASFVAPSQLQVLPGFEKKQESSVETSGLYRKALLTRALEPGVLQAWGNPVNKVTPFVNFGSATDNAYILLADTWGLIPVAALFFIGLALLLVIVRSYTSDSEPLLAIPIVAFASLVALFFVAFITQQQVEIWMLLGAAAVAAERLRHPFAAEARSAT